MNGTIKANGRHCSGPPLTIYLAAPRGFCAGVERAIQIVELALAKYGAPVYVRHAIVHNRHVVESLKAKGAIFVEELDEIPETDAPVVFSAHGVPKAVPEAARSRRMFVLDATCPLVSKVHVEAGRHFQDEREILLIGHAGHPEVIGTMGQLPKGSVHLIQTIDDALSFTPKNPAKLAVITQTTLSVDDTKEIVDVLKAAFPAHGDPAQGRYLLRHDQSPGRGEADRAALRAHDRGGLAQQLELGPPRGGGRAGRLSPGDAHPVCQGDRLVALRRHQAPRCHRRRLSTRGSGR
jgi:hypothetical protein